MDNAQLQRDLIFSICVANKPAERTRKTVDVLLSLGEGETPFARVRDLIKRGALWPALVQARTGQYSRIEQALRYVAETDIDLDNCSVDELLKIPGVGNKTARFFILWHKPEARLAALDTHILKFLRDKGYDVPKVTPQSDKKYAEVEAMFLAEADKAGKLPGKYDYEIWLEYSKGAARTQ